MGVGQESKRNTQNAHYWSPAKKGGIVIPNRLVVPCPQHRDWVRQLARERGEA